MQVLFDALLCKKPAFNDNRHEIMNIEQMIFNRFLWQQKNPQRHQHQRRLLRQYMAETESHQRPLERHIAKKVMEAH